MATTRDVILDEVYRSKQYGPLRERPKAGYRLVAVINSEDARKVCLYWERTRRT